MSKKYTAEEKIAYYKKKAAQAGGAGNQAKYERNQGRYIKHKQRRTAAVGEKSRYLAPALSTAGGALGAAIGGVPGGLVGSTLGALAGQGIKYFTGFGDYHIKQNALLSEQTNKPIVNRNIHGGTVIRKSEYLGDLFSSPTPGLFSSRTFQVNPADINTFPWLSQIAANYEEYVMEGMYFEYRSMSSDALNSTNTALGTVVMSSQYNVNSEDFTSKQEMENHEFGISVKPSESMRYFVECAKNQSVLGEMYIRAPRNLSLPSNISDRRFSDICDFQIASQGVQGANVNLGEIWVTYQVCLLKSRMYDSLGLSSLSYTYVNDTGVTSANLLGTVADANVAFDNIGLNVASPVTITMPIGFNSSRKTFIMIYSMRGTSTASVTTTGLLLTSAGISTQVISPITAPDGSGATATKAIKAWLVTLDGAGSQVNLTLTPGAAVFPTSPVEATFQIFQVPNGYISSDL